MLNTEDRFIVYDTNGSVVGHSRDGSHWIFNELPIGRKYQVFDRQHNRYTTEVFNEHVIQVSPTHSDCYIPKGLLNIQW